MLPAASHSSYGFRFMLKHFSQIVIVTSVLLLAACGGHSTYGPGSYATQKQRQGQHIVQKGETFYSIAKRYGMNVKMLSRYNPKVVPSRLLAGTVLSIPVDKNEVANDRVPYVVQKGDTLSRIADHFAVKLNELKLINPTIDPRKLSVGQKIWIPTGERKVEGFIWPLNNPRMISGFGEEDWGLQKGVNLIAQHGQTVFAAKEGTVSFAGSMRSLGKVIIIQHPGDQQTVYAGCDTLKVKVGDKVKQRQSIATVGHNSLVNRPALHFQFRDRGAPLPPENYLPAIASTR